MTQAERDSLRFYALTGWMRLNLRCCAACAIGVAIWAIARDSKAPGLLVPCSSARPWRDTNCLGIIRDAWAMRPS